MDANGLRFWMLARAQDWRDLQNAAYDASRRTLCLAATRAIDPASAATREQARARLDLAPRALDELGSSAWWDGAEGKVRVRSPLPDAGSIYTPAAGFAPTDLAVGFDGILYLALDGRIVMKDLRDRWDDETVAASGFSAWRLAADPAGGVWALDRANARVARLRGVPFPARPEAQYSGTTFRPGIENPGAPRLALEADLSLGAGEELIGVAASPAGKLALLCWRADADAFVLIVEEGRTSAPRTLAGSRSPYSIAWLSETRVAVLLAGVEEAPAYELPEADSALEVKVCGDFYPLARHDGGPFAHALSLPPRFGVLTGELSGDARPDVRALYPVSFPLYEKQGEARNFGAGGAALLDSGSPETCWHRLYLEAAFPPGSGAVLWLAATNTRQAPAPGRADAWAPHVFGAARVPGVSGALPRGAWLSQPSEIPFHSGLLHCPPAREASGLFTVLVQRAAGPVKALRGRYLWVRVALQGDGRSTPEIAALRAYASRFSYIEQYLPEIYRDIQYGREPAAPDARAAPADFLERFMGNFEGVLTSLEDRIASAYVLTHPASTPEDALPWLASWIDAVPPPGMPAARSREWLKAAPFLHRRRGTLGGLRLALELATGGRLFRVPASSVRTARPAAPGDLVPVQTLDGSASIEALLLSAEGAAAHGELRVVAGGAVSGGELVILEDFRLRRVVATILGADLAEEDDPLLPGLTVSGNSVVGDSLMLGDEERREFLALFSADLETSDAEARAIGALFEQLAHRVTVLAHQELEPVDLGLVRALAAREAPAHVQVRVVAARYPFLVGIASLVGVDTYLAPRAPRQPVRVDAAAIGARDFVLQAAALDPRVAGAPPRPTS